MFAGISSRHNGQHISNELNIPHWPTSLTAAFGLRTCFRFAISSPHPVAAERAVGHEPRFFRLPHFVVSTGRFR